MSKATVSGGTDGLYTATVEVDDGHTEVASIYCCDLTENLSGTVGIIDIAGDRLKGQHVQPGYGGNAVYNATRDGELYRVPQKGGSQHSAGNFYNWSLRPGAQKWKPNYRYGTISNLDTTADTCDVALDACVSTDTPDGNTLDCNQATSLSGVSIEYMDCDSSAFENGDEVIVKFTGNSWGSPVVIGFKEEPKSCYWEGWAGPNIDSKHAWTVTPYAGFTAGLSDGILGMSITGETPFFGEVEFQENGEQGPDVGEFVIKANGTGSGVQGRSRITLEDPTGFYAILYFYKGASVSCITTEDGYCGVIGYNGGEEQTIDLASLGLSSRIVKITFMIYNLYLPVTLDIDYIDFK